jgi:hypothetical protein
MRFVSLGSYGDDWEAESVGRLEYVLAKVTYVLCRW